MFRYLFSFLPITVIFVLVKKGERSFEYSKSCDSLWFRVKCGTIIAKTVGFSNMIF